MNYKTTFENNCKDPKTLELVNRFINIAHINEIVMFIDDSEKVSITFNHYGVIYEAIFNPLTQMGSVKPLQMMFLGEEGTTTKEMFITADKFEALLKSMPHLQDFVEDNAGGVTH